jgi:hypothetical protein
MAIIKETGAVVAGANSLLTVAEFRTAAAQRPGAAAVIALTDADIEALLVTSWRMIENIMNWYGSPVSATERNMLWPRSGMKNKEGSVAYASNVIPNNLINAQMETAIQLGLDNTINQGVGEVTSMSVTGLSVGFKAKDNAGSRRDYLPSVVYDYLRPFGTFRTDEPSYTLSRKLWG